MLLGALNTVPIAVKGSTVSLTEDGIIDAAMRWCRMVCWQERVSITDARRNAAVSGRHWPARPHRLYVTVPHGCPTFLFVRPNGQFLKRSWAGLTN